LGRIRINSEHAQVRSLGFFERWRTGLRAKKGVVKRTTHGESIPTYSPAMTIANLLYPTEFPRQIASKWEKGQKTTTTTYSEKVHLDKKSQKGVEAYYARDNRDRFEFWDRILVRREKEHEIQMEGIASKRAKQIFDESGLTVIHSTPNSGIQKGKTHIAFFEVKEIFLPKLKQKIASLPEGLQKKQALELLEELEKHSTSGGTIKTHSSW